VKKATSIYYFIFGTLTIAGGLWGFLKASSMPSLAAGVAAGVTLLMAGTLIYSKPKLFIILGLVVSVLLAGRFVPVFIGGKPFFVAGLMALLSVGGIAISAAALIRGK
jgi:uncharacterized membrane protein (UPF0136 family)